MIPCKRIIDRPVGALCAPIRSFDVPVFLFWIMVTFFLSGPTPAATGDGIRTVEFYVGLGNRKLKKGDAVTARMFYEKAHARGMDTDSLLYLLARSYEMENKFDSALVCNLAMDPPHRSRIRSAGYSQRRRLYRRKGWDPYEDEELRRYEKQRDHSTALLPDAFLSVGGGAGTTRLWKAHEPFTEPAYVGYDSVELIPHWGVTGKLKWRIPVQGLKFLIATEGSLRDYETNDFPHYDQLYRKLGGQLGIGGSRLRFSLLGRISRIRLFEPKLKLGAETSFSSFSDRAFRTARLQVALSTPYQTGFDPEYVLFTYISIDQIAVREFGFSFTLYSQILNGSAVQYPYILMDVDPESEIGQGYELEYCTQPLRYLSLAPEIRIGGSPGSLLRVELGVRWQTDFYFDDTRWYVVQGRELDALSGELSEGEIREMRKKRLDHVPAAEARVGIDLPGGAAVAATVGYERTFSSLHSLRPYEIPHSRWSATLKWTMLLRSSRQ